MTAIIRLEAVRRRFGRVEAGGDPARGLRCRGAARRAGAAGPHTRISAAWWTISSALNEEAAQVAEEVDGLPRPVPVLVRGGGGYGVRMEFDEPPPEGWHLKLRFRPSDDSGLDEYGSAVVGVDSPHWVSPRQIRHGQVCVQAGLGRAGATLYEDWMCLPTSQALQE